MQRQCVRARLIARKKYAIGITARTDATSARCDHDGIRIELRCDDAATAIAAHATPRISGFGDAVASPTGAPHFKQRGVAGTPS